MGRAGIGRLDLDRAILAGACAALAGLAWIFLARGMASTGGVGRMAALLAMWAAMMAAMMLPATLPYLFAFSAEQRRRRGRGLSAIPAAFFLAGYLAIWTGFSVVCAGLQAWLQAGGLLGPGMALASPVLAGLVVAAGGVYQWLPLKQSCLRHCRSPLGFLLGDWREGRSGAFRMGAGHGVFCLGCCWLLMLLPFAAGVMSLAWMAAIAGLVLVEKAAPDGVVAGRIGGGALVLAGALMMGSGWAP